jgi:hypothetical protein
MVMGVTESHAWLTSEANTRPEQASGEILRLYGTMWSSDHLGNPLWKAGENSSPVLCTKR